MEPFFDLVLLPQVDSSARENINSPRYFKFFFRKLQQQVVIVHGSNNVILQKYEVHCFIEQIHVTSADFPQPLQRGFLWNRKLFQCG